MSRGRVLAIAGAILLTHLTTSFYVFAQEDVVEKRKEVMRANNNDVKAISKAAEEKDYVTIGLKAKDITENVDKYLALFPKGSTAEKSRAHPDIWVKSDEFKNLTANARKAADALMKAAAAKKQPGC